MDLWPTNHNKRLRDRKLHTQIITSAFLIVSVGGKLYENSHSHTASETTSLGGSVGYKRPQSSSSGPGIGGAAAAIGGGGGEEGVKKKKKGNWRNRFGPCFTTDVKPSEPAPSLTLPTSSTSNTCSSTASSSSSSSSSSLSSRPGLVSSSGLGVGVGVGVGERGLGVMGGIQKSPSLLRNGSLQSNSGSATAGLGEADTVGLHTTHSNAQRVFKHSDLTIRNILSDPSVCRLHLGSCLSNLLWLNTTNIY